MKLRSIFNINPFALLRNMSLFLLIYFITPFDTVAYISTFVLLILIISFDRQAMIRINKRQQLQRDKNQRNKKSKDSNI